MFISWFVEECNLCILLTNSSQTLSGFPGYDLEDKYNLKFYYMSFYGHLELAWAPRVEDDSCVHITGYCVQSLSGNRR